MSKKKNTLQDLDDFLKQQAATLVAPESLQTSTETAAVAPDTQHQPAEKQSVAESNVLGSKHDPAFRKKLYNFIIESLENQKDSLPEDKMLINTALYLKSGNDWKNVIREYWRER
jgi:hypothetical protein